MASGVYKCRACGSYVRGWRRKGDFLSVNLALLLALLTILTMALPPLYRTFRRHEDRININFVGIDTKSSDLTLLCFNQGSRAGAIRSVVIVAPPSVALRTTLPSWQLDLPENTLVGPGEARQITFGSSARPLPRLAVAGEPFNVYEVEVQWLRFNGMSVLYTIPIRIPRTE